MTNPSSAVTLVAAYPVERRINPFKPEYRSAGEGAPPHIVGYASVFNKLSRKLSGGFVERVNPSAFRSSKERMWEDVVCRWNHNDDFLLGTIAGRTLMIDYDQDGLAYDVIPPRAEQKVLELTQRGDVSSSSFAFRMPQDGGDEWALSDFGMPLRTLLDVDLVDVAPVTTPAYPDATAAARAFEGAVESLARQFDVEPTEIRSLFENNQTVKLFRRTDRRSADVVEPPTVPSIPEQPALSGQNAAYYEEAFNEIEGRKDYSADDRKKLAKSGHAMPDGSFPIEDEDDLHNAVKLAGNASNPAAAKAHIKKRAKAMGKTDAIPDTWDGDEKKSEDTDIDAEIRAAEDFLAKVKAKKAKGKKKGDDTKDETDGNDSSGNGTEDEGRAEGDEEDEETEEGTEEERAAKASYHDLETCGKCGATDQFGKHCVSCGNSMEPPAADPHGNGKFCANCGSKMPVAPAKRSDHECEVERREDETPVEAPASTEEVTNGHVIDNGEAQLAKLGLERRQRELEFLQKRVDPYAGLDD